MSVLRLEGTIQNYDWGCRTAIAELLGRAPSQHPEAELWMGAHPRGPSTVVEGCGGTPVDLATVLGRDPRLAAGAELPFLFKVLAAARPLSLQAHPSREQAREGFRREDRRGIGLDDPRRCYQDEHEKPELIYALTPFTAFCGFARQTTLEDRFRHFGLFGGESADGDSFLPFVRDASPAVWRDSFRRLLRLPRERRAAMVSRLQDHCSQPTSDEELKRFSQVIPTLQRLYPDDAGILAALLLNLVQLDVGQALYLPSGVLHAYVQGTGLEIMANSDNVLRGGLTSKHVDVEELTRVVRFEPGAVSLVEQVVERSAGGAVVRRLLTQAPQFELSLVESDAPEHFDEFDGLGLLLVLEGQVTVESQGQRMRLKRGQQAFCSDDAGHRITGEGRVARARRNSRANRS